MILHGGGTGYQPLGYLKVALALHDQCQYFLFTLRQAASLRRRQDCCASGSLFFLTSTIGDVSEVDNDTVDCGVVDKVHSDSFD